MPDKSAANLRVPLRKRVMLTAAWVASSHLTAQALRLLANLLLTRLLLPEAFGLMAIVSTLMMTMNLLADIGTGTVIVQSRRGADVAFLQTAWTLQVLRGLGLWALGLMCALGIVYAQSWDWFRAGTVYADERLPLLVGAATFSMVIQGLGTVNDRVAQRNLDIRRVLVIDLSVQVISLVSMVIAAALTGSVWSLVAGSMLAVLLRNLAGHGLLPGPSPRFQLERDAVRELLGKGKWMAASSVLGCLAVNGDRLLLGGLVGAGTLGLYSIALGLASTATAACSGLLAKVIFPAFSEVVRDRNDQLRAVYRKFQRVVDALIGVVAGMIYMTSDIIIRVLYDNRYADAGLMLGYLILGTIGIRFLVVEQIYLALGRNYLLVIAIIPRILILFIGLPVGYEFGGIQGALFAVVLSQFGNWPMAIWFRAKHGLKQLSNDFVLPLALAIGFICGWVIEGLVVAAGYHQAVTLLPVLSDKL